MAEMLDDFIHAAPDERRPNIQLYGSRQPNFRAWSFSLYLEGHQSIIRVRECDVAHNPFRVHLYCQIP